MQKSLEKGHTQKSKEMAYAIYVLFTKGVGYPAQRESRECAARKRTVKVPCRPAENSTCCKLPFMIGMPPYCAAKPRAEALHYTIKKEYMTMWG